MKKLPTRKPHFEYFKDRKREWRWRFRARNGRITAGSGEGYKRPSACRKALDRHIADTADAPIFNLETGVVFHEGMRDN